MQVSSKQLAKYLIETLKQGVNPKELSENFENFLKKNHLETLLPNIVENLLKEKENLEAKNSLHITTSHEMKEKMIKGIEDFVGKEESDKTKVSVDESLIGGFEAVYKGKIYESSVKNYLKQLRESFAK